MPRPPLLCFHPQVTLPPRGGDKRAGVLPPLRSFCAVWREKYTVAVADVGAVKIYAQIYLQAPAE